MSTPELSKTYDPAAQEARIYAMWLAEGCFTANPADPGDPYCIVIPPPNVTGALHLGHALNNTLQDILTRRSRMAGLNTLWVPGVDHAGIATQAVVEKQLKEQENKTRHDVGREGLVERIWAWKQQYGDRIISQLQRMGCSCDWTRTRFTLDEMCARAVRETFFKLFKDGLVFRGKRLVNWDTHLQTSISDDEIYYETVKTSLWHIRYPIDGTDKEMVVATTRPETMLADTAVAVHPDDPRWNWAIGKNVRLPLTGRLVPIIADPILVNMEFGTGCVKVTPAHDPNDYAVWQRQGGKIACLNLMTLDGRVNKDEEQWAAYAGLTFAQARKKVVADLGDALLKEEPYETNIGYSDRSKTPIQPFLSDQWFVKMADLAEPALEAVRDGRVKFFPERYAQQYLAWLGEKRDWPISRQLWWGHRIPVWSINPQTVIAIWNKYVGTGRQLEEYQKFGRSLLDGTRELISKYPDDLRIINQLDPTQSQEDIFRAIEGGKWQLYHVCVRTDGHSSISKLESLGWEQDPDVLDTWFSSALWPHSTLGWPDASADLAKWYPTSVLLTGRDIITLWVARMVMLGLYNLGDIPFPHVAINPTILDGNGERMSKSKGNGVDPVDIIDTAGADALRFALATMATETQDVRMPVKKDAAGRNTSDKFDLGRNFVTKLWNASRFVMATVAETPAPPTIDEAKWSTADRWIVSRFNRTVADADAAVATYRFDLYAKAAYDFFWRDFCDWYLEAAKPALRDASRAPQTAAILAGVLDGALRLLHPVVPFVTEALWEKLNEVRPARSLPSRIESRSSPRLVKAAWPAVGRVDEEAEATFARLQEIIGVIRALRSDHKADPRKPVPLTVIAPPADCRHIQSNRELIETLGLVTLTAAAPDAPIPANAARASAAGADIHLEGLIDPDAERTRLARRGDELRKSIAALEARLANPAYADKAPPALVNQTRQQLADAQFELAKLG